MLDLSTSEKYPPLAVNRPPLFPSGGPSAPGRRFLLHGETWGPIFTPLRCVRTPHISAPRGGLLRGCVPQNRPPTGYPRKTSILLRGLFGPCRSGSFRPNAWPFCGRIGRILHRSPQFLRVIDEGLVNTSSSPVGTAGLQLLAISRGTSFLSCRSASGWLAEHTHQLFFVSFRCVVSNAM